MGQNAPEWNVRCGVLVVDDHPIFRRGLAAILRSEPWVRTVHEAADHETAVRVALTESVDVVSMDLRLSAGEPEFARSEGPRLDGLGLDGLGLDGLRATRDLLRARPQIAVLVLTMVMEEALVADALAAGARGYLLKSADPDEVVQALHLVARGGVVLGAGVGPTALRAPGGQDGWPPPFDTLTPRERRLAQLVSAGRSNAVIARTLGVSDKTVRNQISALLVRLAVPDRVSVALLARDCGLPASPPGGAWR